MPLLKWARALSLDEREPKRLRSSKPIWLQAFELAEAENFAFISGRLASMPCVQSLGGTLAAV